MGIAFRISVLLALIGVGIDISRLFGCHPSDWFRLLYAPLVLVLAFIGMLIKAMAKEGF